MPEDLHFLSRLSRVERPHVELALRLYRDTGLLRFVVESARPPEQARRVAIALGDAERGPFLVVTRGGDFVTCLGEGMSTGALPVVTRERLDTYMARGAELRERREMALSVTEESGGLGKVLSRVLRAGPAVAREEIMALVSFAPLLRRELWSMVASFSDHARSLRGTLMGRFRHLRDPSPGDLHRMRLLWETLWARAHVLAVVAEHGRRDARLVTALGTALPGTFTWPNTYAGMLGQVALNQFAVARIGKPLLPIYKARLDPRETVEAIQWDVCLGLTSLGLRHAKLTAEVRKALTFEARPGLGGPKAACLELLESEMTQVLEAMHVELGLGVVAMAQKRAPEGSWLRETPLEDVDSSVARAAALLAPFNLHGFNEEIVRILPCLAWAARANIDELYLEGRWAKALRDPFQPIDIVRMLDIQRRFTNQHEPTTVEDKPGRNDKCPCDSGRKYKRCCGA